MTGHERLAGGMVAGSRLAGSMLALDARIGLWVLVFHQTLPLLLFPTLSPACGNARESVVSQASFRPVSVNPVFPPSLNTDVSVLDQSAGGDL
ncbi:hypothetical protein AHiyo4_05120 [Arthrobacter sp. Hiyo4]|nr:hypothetical protein AHiyo4_05120 [Arthrobacter sp. Hiyo4]